MITATPDTVYCGHIRKCGWVGKCEELIDRPNTGLGIKASTKVCPKCGAESFYVRKDGEKPPRGWKAKEPTNSPAWISVEKEMPDSDIAVLIYVPNSPTDSVWIGFHDGDLWRSVDNVPLTDEVTHWMNLPEPPKN